MSVTILVITNMVITNMVRMSDHGKNVSDDDAGHNYIGRNYLTM